MSIFGLLKKISRFLNRQSRVDRYRKRGLIVGENFRMLEDVQIDYSHLWHVVIGDDVTLAPGVRILAHDASTKRHLGYTRIGKVRIGNRVFIGAGSIILPGVAIGDNVIVGAGGIVSRNLEANHVFAGNPAKKICSLENFLARKKEEMESSPVFSEEYTMEKGVTAEMKKEMNQRMIADIGYII